MEDAVAGIAVLQITTLCEKLDVPVNPIGSKKVTPLENTKPAKLAELAYEAVIAFSAQLVVMAVFVAAA